MFGKLRFCGSQLRPRVIEMILELREPLGLRDVLGPLALELGFERRDPRQSRFVIIAKHTRSLSEVRDVIGAIVYTAGTATGAAC